MDSDFGGNRIKKSTIVQKHSNRAINTCKQVRIRYVQVSRQLTDAGIDMTLILLFFCRVIGIGSNDRRTVSSAREPERT